MRKAFLLAVLACLALPVGSLASAQAEASYYFALAKFLMEEGAVAEALEALSQATLLVPDDPYLKMEEAGILSRAGRQKRALAAARSALELAPEDPDILLAFSQIALRMSEREPAVADEVLNALEALRRVKPGETQSMLTLARLYSERNDPRAAADVLEELASHQPGDRIIHFHLVNALLQAGRGAQAEEALEAFLGRDPGYAQAWATLAGIHGERGDYAGAVATLRRAPEAVRQLPDIRGRLAEALYRTGELQESLDTIDAVLLEEPDRTEARYLKSRILAAQGLNNEARGILAELNDESPRDLEIVQHLLTVLERLGDTTEAERLLRETAEDFQRAGNEAGAVWAGYQLAMLHVRLGNWERVLEEVGSFRPLPRQEVADELTLLAAEALQQLGREEEALDALAGIEDVSRVRQRALAKEAEILFASEHDGLALERIAALQTVNGETGVVAAANVYHRLQRYEDAIALLEPMAGPDSSSMEALYWLGAAYERSGQHGKAAEAFSWLLEQDPDFAPALNYLGYMWAENGENLERALALVTRAVALDPENGAYIDSLGWAHFQLGQFHEAKGYLERASRLIPADAVILEHLGDLYRRLGDPEGAAEVYRRALALDGENVEGVRTKLLELDGN